ncbi:MAG: hypothetical protein GY707_08215, partial [Desulfobacteraceae bacterium]|nr:hypothetical protein [Desulfobacteraceae bacterium]
MTETSKTIKITLEPDKNDIVQDISKIKQHLFNIAKPIYFASKNNNGNSEYHFKAYAPSILPEDLGDKDF